MSDIYKVNSADIIGGPGRLVWAPYGTTAPTKISDVMNTTSPYDLVGPWKDLGATTEGIEISRGFETEGFEVDQVLGEVDEDVTGWSHSLSTQLAENTLENRQLALIGSPIVETAPQLGTPTTLVNDVAAGAMILNVTSAAEFAEGGWLQIGTEIIKISKISGNTIYLTEPVKQAYTATENVTPVTELGTKRIGYGTVTDVPLFMLALISQKKDGTLYMAVFRKVKVSGDEKTQNFAKGKRTLPLNLKAFPEDGVAQDENVYYEIEQVR